MSLPTASQIAGMIVELDHDLAKLHCDLEPTALKCHAREQYILGSSGATLVSGHLQSTTRSYGRNHQRADCLLHIEIMSLATAR